MFGAKIKAARTKARLTQKDVTKKTRLPQSYISEIENGEIHVSGMRMATFCKLCDVLNMDASELLEELQSAGELNEIELEPVS